MHWHKHFFHHTFERKVSHFRKLKLRKINRELFVVLRYKSECAASKSLQYFAVTRTSSEPFFHELSNVSKLAHIAVKKFCIKFVIWKEVENSFFTLLIMMIFLFLSFTEKTRLSESFCNQNLRHLSDNGSVYSSRGIGRPP